MTGFNMPPGCNVSDIPGNGPEDAAAEAIIDSFYAFEEQARKQHPDLGDAYVEALAEWHLEQMEKASADGYRSGIADEDFAQEYRRARDIAAGEPTT